MLASLMLASLIFCAYGFAQVQPPTASNPYPMPPQSVQNGPYTPAIAPRAPTPPPPRPPAKPAKPSPATAVAPKPASAPSLLNEPAQPATVRLASGKLSIEAHNSSLSDILGQIAKAGGMKLEGIQANERIFGKYGPGAPRAVLSELLNGSGYNVLMVGETASGTPRELSLTTRSAGGVSTPQPQPAAQDEDSEDEPQPVQYQEPEPQPPTPPAAVPNRVRTPEQILQELQRMRQQQQRPQ